LLFQPLVLVALPDGWYMKSADATWSFSWRDGGSTLLPLSFGVGRVLVREGAAAAQLLRQRGMDGVSSRGAGGAADHRAIRPHGRLPGIPPVVRTGFDTAPTSLRAALNPAPPAGWDGDPND
jgi:hypothetical protein